MKWCLRIGLHGNSEMKGDWMRRADFVRACDLLGLW